MKVWPGLLDSRMFRYAEFLTRSYSFRTFSWRPRIGAMQQFSITEIFAKLCRLAMPLLLTACCRPAVSRCKHKPAGTAAAQRARRPRSDASNDHSGRQAHKRPRTARDRANSRAVGSGRARRAGSQRARVGQPNTAQGPVAAAKHGEPDDGDGCRAQRAPLHPPRRNSRSRARPHRHPAQRRRQSQPVFPARLQSRSRHRHGNLGRRHAGQHAHPRPWPGLRRPQLADAGNRQLARNPKRALLRRRRRLRLGRQSAHQPDRPPRAEHRPDDARQLRLSALFRHGRHKVGQRHAARGRRGRRLQRAVGQSRRHAQAQRPAPLFRGDRDERPVGDRHGLFQQMEFDRPGSGTRDHARRHRPLRRRGCKRWRQHQPLLAVGADGRNRWARLMESQRLCDQERARSLQQFHLFPRQPGARRPVSPARRPPGGRRQRVADIQRLVRAAFATRPRSACRRATTTSASA